MVILKCTDCLLMPSLAKDLACPVLTAKRLLGYVREQNLA